MDDEQFEALIQRMDRRDAERWAEREARLDRREADRDAWNQRFLERMRSSEQHFIEALAENTAEIRSLSEGQDRLREEWRRSMHDMRESIRADTRAVLSVLDRLDRLEGGTA